MNEDLLRQRFNAARQNGCNFAAVRMPGTEDHYFFYATAHAAMRRVDYTEPDRPVFLYSPYSAGNKAYTLLSDTVYLNDTCIFGAPLEETPVGGMARWHEGLSDTNFFADEAFYSGYVGKILGEIGNDRLDKVVAARCVRQPLSAPFDAAGVFRDACNKYPDACVYFFSTKDAGTWFGASPEKLLSVHNATVETVAVAGTLPAESDDDWTDKEYDEQGMIGFFIDEAFKAGGFRNIKTTGTETLVAGNVKHLYTGFKATATEEFLETRLHKFLNELNPTPAVCGLPQFDASLFIAVNEKMERRFYSGFAGIRLPGKTLSLFVSLRCAELFGTHALLYAGAGITAGSIAEKEWNETQRKLETIGSIL